jgi:hypothetical protein
VEESAKFVTTLKKNMRVEMVAQWMVVTVQLEEKDSKHLY